MSAPIVFISNQRIKEGKLEQYKEYYRKTAKFAEENKPGTVAHLCFTNADGTEASVVHIFPDVEAMEAHMRGIGEVARPALEFMEIASFDIYGNPGDAMLQTMRAAAGSTVEVHLKPQPVGGYLRLR